MLAVLGAVFTAAVGINTGGYERNRELGRERAQKGACGLCHYLRDRNACYTDCWPYVDTYHCALFLNRSGLDRVIADASLRVESNVSEMHTRPPPPWTVFE